MIVPHPTFFQIPVVIRSGRNAVGSMRKSRALPPRATITLLIMPVRVNMAYAIEYTITQEKK